MRIGILLAVGLVAAGCGRVEDGINDPGVVCTAIAVSSLNVTVRDAATAARVCDAVVVAVDETGQRHDLMSFAPDPQRCTYAGPWERPGVFEVAVEKAGYRTARVAGIRVGRDECHVIPVQLAVDVQPD
jgi:hypothetical protein